MRANRPAPPAYRNVLVLAGLMLVALGVGNWIVGATRAAPHAEYLRRNPVPSLPPGGLKTRLLDPRDEGLEERSVSRAKLEFYELVRSGGRLLVLLGSLCLVAGTIGLEALRALSGEAARGEKMPQGRRLLP